MQKNVLALQKLTSRAPSLNGVGAAKHSKNSKHHHCGGGSFLSVALC